MLNSTLEDFSTTKGKFLAGLLGRAQEGKPFDLSAIRKRLPIVKILEETPEGETIELKPKQWVLLEEAFKEVQWAVAKADIVAVADELHEIVEGN